MQIFDISRELTSCVRSPGCDAPELVRALDIQKGSECNYTYLRASVHTATHCDATLHFVGEGIDIADTSLTYFVGDCYVMTVPPDSLITLKHLASIPDGIKRLLLHGGGNTHLSVEAAAHLVQRGIITVGTDAFSVGAPHNDTAVHVELLSNQVAIVENLDLSCVDDGFYFLSAAPCKIRGAEASFCRAFLLSDM